MAYLQIVLFLLCSVISLECLDSMLKNANNYLQGRNQGCRNYGALQKVIVQRSRKLQNFGYFAYFKTAHAHVYVKGGLYFVGHTQGPFTVSFESYEDCKGPKSKNITIFTTSMDKKMLVAHINLTFLADAKIDGIKTVVHNIKENKKIFLWNYKLNDPCKHYSIAAMINRYLEAANCLVKKGTYYQEINFGEVMSSFLGNSFFYGTYSYKSDITSKHGNIACLNATMTFKKKV